MRVAIVEDDSDQALHLEVWLKDAGYDCHIFKTGQAAIKGLQKESFDLVLLDWLLPETNGDEVLAWIRNNIDWKLPVIFVTQRDGAQDLAYIPSTNIARQNYVRPRVMSSNERSKRSARSTY